MRISYTLVAGGRQTADVPIDEFWLDDNAMARISRLAPSSTHVLQSLRGGWPRLFPDPRCPSDVYRGVAMVLTPLLHRLHNRMAIGEIEQLIDLVDQSIVRSLPDRSDLLAGANLWTSNVWIFAHKSVSSTQELMVILESQLLCAAQKFITARQLGL
jgi:hypothetical protein